MYNSEKLQAYLKSAGADFSNPASLIPLGYKACEEGDLQKAQAIAELAVSLAPENPQILREASGVLSVVRDFRRCEELITKAIALTPDNPEFHLHYAVILIELQEYDNAEAALEMHFRYAPDSHLGWRNFSSILGAHGDYVQAEKAAERALTLDPANREYAIHRIGLLIVLERISDALKELTRLEKDQPDDPTVARLYSATYEIVGDSDAAIQFAERAYKLAPHRLEYEQHLEHLQKVRGSIQLTGSVDRAERPQRHAPIKIDYSNWKQLNKAIQVSTRVIVSLIIREARTRFGGTRLGYGWAIFEPVSHLMLLAVVFSFMHPYGGAPIGDSLLIYYFTGVLLYILFTNTISHVQAGIESNRSLLQIPIVKPLDVLLARGLLELLTEVSVAVIMFTAFTIYGLDGIPHDIIKCAKAVIAIWCLGVGFGAINSVLMHFIKSWDHVFASLTRALYFVSGIFFSPLTMPPGIRDILAWNPMLQGIDLFRSGFFPYYEPYWLNTTYLYACSAIVLTIGLGMERALRRRVSSPT